MDGLTASHRLERSGAGRKPLPVLVDIITGRKCGWAAKETDAKLVSYGQERPVPRIDGAGRPVCGRAVATATGAGS
jgi:hypothetical protein